jgi:hypothetical protein
MYKLELLLFSLLFFNPFDNYDNNPTIESFPS